MTRIQPPRPHSRILLIALAALAMVGCAQNAILELQVELPAAPPDDGTGKPWFAQIQVRRSSDHPFEIPWTGGDLTSVELGAAPQWDCISVQSFDEAIDLNVRVRFCRSSNCLDIDDGRRRERWYEVEHPFYIGRRTYWRTSITEVPECESDGDCGGVGVCTDGVCGCELTTECPSSMTCATGDETSLGNCVLVVNRCQIEGCIEGDSTTYCSDGSGPHFCEENANTERLGSYECDVTVD